MPRRFGLRLCALGLGLISGAVFLSAIVTAFLCVTALTSSIETQYKLRSFFLGAPISVSMLLLGRSLFNFAFRLWADQDTSGQTGLWRPLALSKRRPPGAGDLPHVLHHPAAVPRDCRKVAEHRPCIATMIHGTFARGAEWMDGTLPNAMRAFNPAMVIKKFNWSGINSHTERASSQRSLQWFLTTLNSCCRHSFVW